nr:fatty acid synthase-like [Leptinotarsa decemlineata]
MVSDDKKGPEEGSDGKANYNLLQGKLLTSPAPGEEIVISGAAGAFPASRTIEEFKNNLMNKVTMVTPNRRWGNIHAEIPLCSGTLPVIETFDAGFFGIHERLGQWQDTMSRLILEKTMEAIFDAGLHPSELENTKTGVFIGTCFSESEKTIFFDQQLPQRYGFLGVSRNMLAHRISYHLKLKGPSFVTDTACSSSLYALEHAFRSLRLGEVDTAIVGGINLCLHPLVSLQFARLGVLSIDGSCKVFDEAANGYARSETAGILILQKAKVAKRKYAEIIHVKTNCDGFKENGITFPSKIAQQTLLEEFYEECGVDRYSLSYLEAHGTGTSVGDPEETGAIDDVLTKGRKTHLLIGSVKSNIGHSEPSSGIASVVKCLIGLETGIIPPNSHFKKPNKNIPGLVEGRLKVVSEPMPFEDDRGLIGINSFGFGGGNCHTLLRKNKKEKLNSGLPSDDIPRLICLSGRTEESIISLLDEVKNNVLDAEYIRLLHNIFRFAIPNQLFRGFAIVSKSGEICRFLDSFRNDIRPLYLGFGELNNWSHIGNNLLALPEFSNSIQRIQEKLSVLGIDIIDTFQKDSIDRETHHILGSVAVQIGLIDLFKVLKINPKDYFGYSFGELVCAYANGICNLEETMNCAFIINESINKLADFYEIGNDRKDINSCDVSLLDKIREKLKVEESATTRKQVLQNLTNFMRSSSINNKLTKQTLANMDYFVDCLAKDALQNFGKIESMSIFLTVGKFPAEENIVDVKVTQLFSFQCDNHLDEFLKVLGHLYIGGHDQHLSCLYPEIELPVSRGTKMISPYVKWKHDSRQWFTPLYDLVAKNVAQQGARTVGIQLSDLEWSFVDGHVIDGRNLFPATGYLYLVWETLCIIEDRPLNILHVVFENCKFMRATTVPNKGILKLKVVLSTVSGNFEILEGDSTVMSGRMYETYEGVDEPICGTRSDGSNLTMKTKDIYKELTLRGYNYKGEFRSIVECNASATEGRIRWHDNWVAFLDNMLQMKILGTDSRLLYVPTFIERVVIPGKQLTKWIIDEFNEKGLDPILPVYNNKESGEIRCGQTVIRGLIASSIARRKDLGVPVLEKYIFVPNITTLELQESIRVNMQIFLENSMVYKVKVIELIDEFTKEINTPLTPIIQTVFGDQPLIQTLPKILSGEALDVAIPVENKKLSEEKDCLLIVVSRLFERPEILQTAFSSLKENGFIISRESSDFNISDTKKLDVSVCTVHKVGLETHVLLKRNHKPRNSVTLEVNSSNDFSWIEKTQELIKNKSSDSVILYSDNRDKSGVLGLVNCLRREPESSHVKGLFVMDEDRDINFEDPLFSEQLKKNMAINVFKDGVWGTYRHLLAEDTDQVQNEHCFVNPRMRGDLSSLSWFEGPLRHDMCIPPERKLVSVYYASLNFRDVMTASGKINADIVTSDRIEQECVQGFEYSGLDSEGNKIMGMVTHGALSSYVLIDNYIAFSVPDKFSLEEAATIPVVYGTVIYGLILRAQLKRGESILIHSGTGGVGQAAIRIALHYGCRIYTTVGTEEKREFLKQTFPSLKDHHIGNSRDTSFEKLVMRGTKGRGVDLVLNSLAEEKLQASIRCLAKGGRFVEIGKFDMGKNADCNLLLLEREGSFHGVMVDQLMPLVPCEKARVAAILEKGMEDGFVQPLNRTVFEYDQVEDAFRYMSTGKHMGKVLIKMREPEKQHKAVPAVLKFPCRARYSCTDTDTYIICGGLGGFGLELADWLVIRGARILVLTSRKGISTGYQQYRINIWRSYGVTVHICKANITTREGCRSLIEEARQLGDVKAIFNLAVVLADAIFENQTQESFATSFGPKAVATKYLDEISRELCPNLR